MIHATSRLCFDSLSCHSFFKTPASYNFNSTFTMAHNPKKLLRQQNVFPIIYGSGYGYNTESSSGSTSRSSSGSGSGSAAGPGTSDDVETVVCYSFLMLQQNL